MFSVSYKARTVSLLQTNIGFFFMAIYIIRKQGKKESKGSHIEKAKWVWHSVASMCTHDVRMWHHGICSVPQVHASFLLVQTLVEGVYLTAANHGYHLDYWSADFPRVIAFCFLCFHNFCSPAGMYMCTCLWEVYICIHMCICVCCHLVMVLSSGRVYIYFVYTTVKTGK